MSDHAPTASHTTPGHDDPMSHVPPPSIWPVLMGAVALTIVPIATLAVLGKFKMSGNFIGLHLLPAFSLTSGVGRGLIVVGALALLFTLMGWAHQIIKEKPLSHDPAQAQSDLKFFLLLFLLGELVIFGVIFAYFYHRKIWDHTGDFTVPHIMHFGGPVVAYATFLLISSSVTCEIAHQFLERGKRGWTKFFLLATIILGTVFLGYQGKEYGELIARGFTPAILAAQGYEGHATFASLFYTSTGFHGVHVAIGLVMLMMVLLRLEAGHFQGRRHFSAIAASWYWHFVDIVWVFLFITVYVVG